MNKLLGVLLFCCITAPVIAQPTDGPVEAAIEKPVEAAQEVAAAKKNPASEANKKIVREANINLQTTVTGNQEQPRVMYIMPWQSPLSPELEMEMLSSQEDAVFGHVEREELTRELEAVDE